MNKYFYHDFYRHLEDSEDSAMCTKMVFVVGLLLSLSVNFSMVFANESCNAEFHTKKEEQQIIRTWTYSDNTKYELVISKSCEADGVQSSIIIFLRTFALDNESVDDVKERLIENGIKSQSTSRVLDFWVNYKARSVSISWL